MRTFYSDQFDGRSFTLGWLDEVRLPAFPGVTDSATTGDVELNDDIEALGFSTGATSMDAFLFVYKRPGS